MKNTLLLFFAFALASCNCSTSSTDNTNTKDAVMQVDKDFNDYCTKHGQAAAFIKYADSSQISMGENSLPIMGIVKLQESFSKRHDTVSKLTWEPSKAEASRDLGYTFGWWKFYTKTAIGKDTIYQGVYVTVWKKQKDGSSWKYVLDGGNDTPAHDN